MQQRDRITSNSSPRYGISSISHSFFTRSSKAGCDVKVSRPAHDEDGRNRHRLPGCHSPTSSLRKKGNGRIGRRTARRSEIQRDEDREADLRRANRGVWERQERMRSPAVLRAE
ncbi:Non-lysosomal glucosylceramidase (NLGase) [Psidium guajava]|nr:Non-lysosomal glucosylceramidase (NLGase) [Psidium guajava]